MVVVVVVVDGVVGPLGERVMVLRIADMINSLQPKGIRLLCYWWSAKNGLSQVFPSCYILRMPT